MTAKDIRVEVDLSKLISFPELPDPINVIGMPTKAQLTSLPENTMMIVWLTRGNSAKDVMTTAKFINRFIASLIAQSPKLKRIKTHLSIMAVPLVKQSDREPLVAGYMSKLNEQTMWTAPAGFNRGLTPRKTLINEDPFFYNTLKEEVS